MTDLHWLAFAVVTVLSGARLTRLLTHDSFPPAVWLRDKWFDLTDRNDSLRKWQVLFFCPYCMSFWATGSVLLWGWWAMTSASGDHQTAWWLINGALGLAYVSAIMVVFDGDDSESEDPPAPRPYDPFNDGADS